MPDEIIITPTDEGFMYSAMAMADSILSDVKKSRREDSRLLMASIIEIAAFLGGARPDLVRMFIGRYDPPPCPRCEDPEYE